MLVPTGTKASSINYSSDQSQQVQLFQIKLQNVFSNELTWCERLWALPSEQYNKYSKSLLVHVEKESREEAQSVPDLPAQDRSLSKT